MASIRNSISMQDRMTPVFKSIVKSMDSTLRVMEKLDRQANRGVSSRAYRQAEKDIKRAGNEIIRMNNSLGVADKSARALAQSTSRVSASAQGFRSASFNLVNLASALYLIKNIASTLGSVMTTADQAKSAVARLGIFNTSSNSAKDIYGQVFSTAMETRTGLSETANLVNRILMSGALTGETAPGVSTKIAGIVNKALVAGGGTAEENSRALLQLSQGLSSGVLQGDELRSIREQAPYLARVLAEGLGKVDEKFAGLGIGDLKELGREGELTSSRILKAFMLMENEVSAAFDEMPKTFGQAMTQLESLWTYFLLLLSDTEGPLGRINDKLWQFIDYMTTPQGLGLLEGLASGMAALADGILWVADLVSSGVTYLQENIVALQASFITLGVVAAAAAAIMFVSWLAATWPVLLVLAAIYAIAYAALQSGYTVSEVIGSIVGGVVFLAYLIWDIIMGIVSAVLMAAVLIWDGIVGLATGIVLIIQMVMQIILWAIGIIVALILGVGMLIGTVFLLAGAAIKLFINGAVTGFYALAQTVLGVMTVIAAAIDAVFGSNLQKAVQGWSGTLETKYNAFIQSNDPAANLDMIKEGWAGADKTVSDLFNGPLNLIDNMGDVLNGAGNLMVDPMWGQDFLNGFYVDPMEGYKNGYDWGSDLGDKLAGFDMNIGDSIANALNNPMFDGLTVDDIKVRGGDLDSVGKIKSDVDISDEDLKLLRDISARDFLLQLQSITPIVKASFGDVHETADVRKLMEVIEDMVEEQMATALVS